MRPVNAGGAPDLFKHLRQGNAQISRAQKLFGAHRHGFQDDIAAMSRKAGKEVVERCRDGYLQLGYLRLGAEGILPIEALDWISVLRVWEQGCTPYFEPFPHTSPSNFSGKAWLIRSVQH